MNNYVKYDVEQYYILMWIIGELWWRLKNYLKLIEKQKIVEKLCKQERERGRDRNREKMTEKLQETNKFWNVEVILCLHLVFQ